MSQQMMAVRHRNFLRGHVAVSAAIHLLLTRTNERLRVPPTPTTTERNACLLPLRSTRQVTWEALTYDLVDAGNLDRLEIEQLLRYCHAIDRRDWDAYRAVYTDDAVIDDVSAGPGNSVDDMVEFLSQALERVVLIQHAISTSLVDIDRDRASARTVCHCPVVLDRGNGETQMFFQGLWYEDDLVRTPMDWKISKRVEAGYFHNMPPDFRFE